MAGRKPRRRPTQERSRATVDAILEATARVLIDDGHDAASTNRIAERAGVSIGSLYQYFPNKQGLIEALAERHLERLLATILAGFADFAERSIPDLTRELIARVIVANRLDPDLHRALITQAPVDVLGRMQEAIERVLAADIARRRALGENRLDDAELSAFVMVNAVDGVVTSALLRRPDLLDDGRLLDGLTELMLRYSQPVHDPPE